MSTATYSSTLAQKASTRTFTRPLTAVLSRMLVSAYKACGLLMLTAILAGVASYLVLVVFFFVNSRWIIPTILSPADDQVLKLNKQFAEVASLREKMAADRQEMIARLRDDERVTASQIELQSDLQRSVQAALADRKAELQKWQQLNQSYKANVDQITTANQRYSSETKKHLEELYRAHLIDQDSLTTGQYELSQLTNSTLGLAQKNTELDTQVAALSREISSLDVVTSAMGGRRSKHEIKYDVLRIKNEFQASVRDLKNAEENSEAVRQIIQAMNSTIAREERLLKQLSNSPYLKAADQNLTVAFVSYENMGNAKPGTAIFACRLKLVWCSRVGTMGEVLEGEVIGRHPLYNKELRGGMVVMRLDDPKSAREAVLHVGKTPFWLHW